MSRILILLGDKPDKDSEGYKTYVGLQSLARDHYTYAHYRDIQLIISSSMVDVLVDGQSIKKFDLVWIRDFHGYEAERNTIADYCNHMGIRFLNHDVATSQKISKLAQYMAFAFHDISFPRSVYAHTTHLRVTAEKHLSYPMIVKSILAKSGNDNFLVKSRNEFDELMREKPSVKFIAQEAIPNDGDYRVIVLGSIVSCVYRRKAKQGDHRNNISQGGDKQYIALDTVPSEVIQIAIKTAEAVDRQICGVDVMINTDNNQAIILEANFNFGIRAVPGIVSEELYGLSEYLHDQATQ